MRKISVGICLLLALATAGCSNSSRKTNPSAHNQTISVSIKDDPRTLDPREVRLLSDINLIHHLYEGLVQETPSGKDFTTNMDITRDFQTCGYQDLNLGPRHYQCRALTN